MTPRRNWRPALFSVAAALLAACSSEQVVRGQVFLRAPDGTARTLALVKVRAYDEATLRQMAAAQRDSGQTNVVSRVLLALPLDVPTATTDADGNFALAIPAHRRVAIQALAGGGTEPITGWLLWYDPARDGTRLDLTSQNALGRDAGAEVAHALER